MLKQVLQIYEACESDWVAGKPIDQEIIYTWSRRALRAQLQAGSTKEQRLASFQACIVRATRMRDATHKRWLSDEVTLTEVRKVAFYHTMAAQLYINEKLGKDGGWRPLEPIE